MLQTVASISMVWFLFVPHTQSATIQKSPIGGAIIATWNINSVGRWTRDKGDEVITTFETVLEITNILGVQEATGIEDFFYEYEWSNQYEICNLQFEPIGSRARTYRQFAVFVKKDEYSVAKSWAKALPVDEVYGIKCLILPNGVVDTKENRKKHGIVVYNIHLKAGKAAVDAQTRFQELSSLVEDVKADRKKFAAHVILGDFNYYERIDGREKWQELLSHIGIDFVGVLEYTESPEFGETEYGIGNGFLTTTPGGGTYDTIFVIDHVGSYFSPDAFSAMELFVPVNKAEGSTITDYTLSDHLPILASLPAVGNVGSYNIRLFKLSSVLLDDELTEVYAKVFENMDLIAVQEIQQESLLDRKEMMDDMFPEHNWSLADQYACGSRAPYELIEEAQLVNIDNGNRQGLLCKFRKLRYRKATDVCLLNVHALNSLAKKSDITRIIKQARSLLQDDPICNKSTNIVLGDFNNQILQRSTYDKEWSGLKRLDCRHTINDEWTFTAIDYKTRLDHIFVAPPVDTDVQGECQVLSELSGQPNMFKLDTWREISDHFPVFGNFERLV